MTNFPTRQHWFDSIWPDNLSYEVGDERILVPVHRHTNLVELEKDIDNNPGVVFMLTIEDFDHFGRGMPERWLRMPPDGGIPPNVWVGASISTQGEASERMRRLVKVRARKLFILLKKGHHKPIDLKAGLIAWRCSLCGRKDGYGRMRRPKKCPSGSICVDATIDSQIHWVVSMDTYENFGKAKLPALCAEMGVAFWDGQSTQVPE